MCKWPEPETTKNSGSGYSRQHHGSATLLASETPYFLPHTKFIFAMQGPYCICISVMPILSLITVGRSEKHVCHLKNDRRHEPLQAWIS